MAYEIVSVCCKGKVVIVSKNTSDTNMTIHTYECCTCGQPCNIIQQDVNK